MPQTTLIDVFRFATSGFIVLLCLHVANPEATSVLLGFGQGILAGAALAFGALIYILYRALFYTPPIIWLQDRLFRVNPSWREELMARYGISRPQAILLFSQIRPELRPHADRMVHFANAHYGYTASIICFVFVPVAEVYGRCEPALWLFLFGIILFIATFRFHRRGEDEELCELRRLILIN